MTEPDKDVREAMLLGMRNAVVALLGQVSTDRQFGLLTSPAFMDKLNRLDPNYPGEPITLQDALSAYRNAVAYAIDEMVELTFKEK